MLSRGMGPLTTGSASVDAGACAAGAMKDHGAIGPTVRKIPAISMRIAGQQRQPSDFGMSGAWTGRIPLVNRVLTSPYLWWSDPFSAGARGRPAAQKVLAFWQWR